MRTTPQTNDLSDSQEEGNTIHSPTTFWQCPDTIALTACFLSWQERRKIRAVNHFSDDTIRSYDVSIFFVQSITRGMSVFSAETPLYEGEKPQPQTLLEIGTPKVLRYKFHTKMADKSAFELRHYEKGHTNTSSAFSVNACVIARYNYFHKTLNTWDLKTNALLQSITTILSCHTRLAISDDGKTIVSFGDTTVCVWRDGTPIDIGYTPISLRESACILPIFHSTDAAVSADGQTIVIACGRLPYIWRLNEMLAQSRFFRGGSSEP